MFVMVAVGDGKIEVAEGRRRARVGAAVAGSGASVGVSRATTPQPDRAPIINTRRSNVRSPENLINVYLSAIQHKTCDNTTFVASFSDKN